MAIKSKKQVIPMIYAYSTPEITRHNGWVKIGYTEKQTTEQRQKQQSHTIDVEIKEEWKGVAIFDDGSGELFRDTDFHSYLHKLGVERKEKTEWFHIDGANSEREFYNFRKNRGVLKQLNSLIPYTLRDEQQKAVNQTIAYFKANKNGEFLWNAKPRFGKTLSVYHLCKEINADKVLIVTNRPAIANSWYSDYEKFIGTQSGYYFVSSTEALKNKKYVLSRDDYIKKIDENHYKCIEFVSLQDLKGSIYFGGQLDKLREVSDIDWDLLVIDEAHEGVDTYKTDIAFNQIKRKYTLHLSGTPFKALANEKFEEKAIFNWTYADEQKAKNNWAEDEENPYKILPKLNLYTYQMSEIIKDEIKKGIEIDGEIEEFAFDLNEFFETKNGKFVHESSVDKFLNALTIQSKFPFSTDELRNELNHTLWLLNRVDSAKALAKKLENHNVFKDYKIILAAGDGKIDDEEETQKSFDKVIKAIAENEKTITLSVGQLTTGVTVPEWTGVLMLSNIKSPALYMQAAFRAQNPCLFSNCGKFYRKENAYVFDFDPARTLTIFEEFANDLSPKTSNGHGDIETRKENIRELLNFFPVIGEDEQGVMIELDAEKILSIPRKIRSLEVVKRGFMSDFLFQNISNVFHAPTPVIEIINNFIPVEQPKKPISNINNEISSDLSLNEDGEVELSPDYIQNKTENIFGDKIFKEVPDTVQKTVESIEPKDTDKKDDENNALTELKTTISNQIAKTIIDTAKTNYQSDLKPSETKRLENDIKHDLQTLVDTKYSGYKISIIKTEKEYKENINNCQDEEEKAVLTDNLEQDKKQLLEDLKNDLNTSIEDFTQKTAENIVKTVETNKKENEKKEIETSIKDHLRGFSRTIPSFLMAYGNKEDINLDNFDKIIPDNVFKEVTSITLEEFRFLRDGGDYINPETGKQEYFNGKLFDQVVFDDSVKEFLNLKKKLSNYFEETEDIFDYIPPQKTNQIFTPKWVVKKMVDMLEEENPNCFDNPNKTFIDLYMKSGLYITEIVKRLYNSDTLKKLYPKKEDRLKHIFKKQVYGLAPTEIIYKIATNFILGFNEDITSYEHNFKQIDALEYTKNGTLEKRLDDIFR